MSQFIISLGRASSAESERSRLQEFLAVLGENFVAAQQARAERFVRPYLARMSEGELKGLGFSASEIIDIRKDRHLPVVRWI